LTTPFGKSSIITQAVFGDIAEWVPLRPKNPQPSFSQSRLEERFVGVEAQ
jgi:hypothetical protein